MHITFQSHHLNILGETLYPLKVNGKTPTDLRSQILSFVAAYIHFCQPYDKWLIKAQNIP